MKTNWLTIKRIGRMVAGLALLGLVVALLWLWRTDAQRLVTPIQSAQAASVQAAGPLDGNYRGSVELGWTVVGVLSDPLPTPTPAPTGSPAAPDLGAIDLALQLRQNGNTVTGYVDLATTLVFSVEHTLPGPPIVKTGPNVQGTFDGTTLALTSEQVSMNLHGRAIQRQFSLQGSAVGGDPAQISGQYRETLWGYAPQPVTVLGHFTLQRVVFDQTAPDTTNKAPDAVADSSVTGQGTAVTINVVANDTDANGDALAVISISKPQFGTATTNGQTVTYTPNANFVGIDHFTYLVSDSKGAQAAGSVTVTVNGAGGPNQPPSAATDQVGTTPGTAITINVLANDSDPNGDALLITIDSQPVHGTAVVQNGQILYTPQRGYVGVDHFTYIVSDGKGGTAQATVTITISATGQPSVPVYLPLIQR